MSYVVLRVGGSHTEFPGLLQVFVSYGDLANDEMLMTHGVVVPNNKFDNFLIVTALTTEEAQKRFGASSCVLMFSMKSWSQADDSVIEIACRY